MAMKSLIYMLYAVGLATPAEPPQLPHSVANTGRQHLTQVWGGLCQTPFGVCQLIDPNGQPYMAPVGSPCACGADAGIVIQ